MARSAFKSGAEIRDRKREERLDRLSEIFWRHIAPQVTQGDGDVVATKVCRFSGSGCHKAAVVPQKGMASEGPLAAAIGTYFDEPGPVRVVKYRRFGSTVRFVYENEPYLLFLDKSKNNFWIFHLEVPPYFLAKHGEEFLAGSVDVRIAPDILVVEDRTTHTSRRVRLEEVN